MNREEFFAALGNRSPAEFQRIQWAYFFAKEGHRKQKRDGGKRYFEHPRDTVLHLIRIGYLQGLGQVDTDDIVTLLLHDVPEDTYIPPSLLLHCFGQKVYARLMLLSKETPVENLVTGFVTRSKKKQTPDYFARLCEAEVIVQILKCLDRLDNLQTAIAFEPSRRQRYVAETREHILPMAWAHCPAVGREIEALLAPIEASLQASAVS